MPIPRTHRLVQAALITVVFVALAGCGTGAAPAPSAPASQQVSAATVRAEFGRLEREFDARLGVYAVDTATGQELAYHADDRFGYASTYKALAAGAVLQKNTGDELNKLVTYDRSDLESHSPITQDHVETGMRLRAVIDAAVRDSDNTAGNLLLRELGGPNGLDTTLRAIGDTTTHADRLETDLNKTAPGDIRDTSTPRALADSLRVFTTGNALPEDRRAILIDMLRTNTTGKTLIQAGTPAGWQVGDKSGAADYGTRNDIGIVWPPARAPIVIAILSDRSAKDADYNDALIARATTVALGTFR